MSSNSDTPTNRRAHERLDIFVQVEIRGEEEISIVKARNLSAGGLFLELEAGDPELRPGTSVTLYLYFGDDKNDESISLVSSAEVVHLQERTDTSPGGVGLKWTSDEADFDRRLERILGRAP